MLTLQNNCKLRKEKQILGNSFSHFYNGSFKLFQWSRAGGKSCWEDESVLVVIDLIWSKATVRKKKFTLFLFFSKCEKKNARSQQDIQEGNRKDMQSEVSPLGTSREEKIKIMKIMCVE